MTFLEKFVDNLTHEEELADMHFSTYYIPPEFQPSEADEQRA